VLLLTFPTSVISHIPIPSCDLRSRCAVPSLFFVARAKLHPSLSPSLFASWISSHLSQTCHTLPVTNVPVPRILIFLFRALFLPSTHPPSPNSKESPPYTTPSRGSFGWLRGSCVRAGLRSPSFSPVFLDAFRFFPSALACLSSGPRFSVRTEFPPSTAVDKFLFFLNPLVSFSPFS